MRVSLKFPLSYTELICANGLVLTLTCIEVRRWVKVILQWGMLSNTFLKAAKPVSLFCLSLHKNYRIDNELFFTPLMISFAAFLFLIQNVMFLNLSIYAVATKFLQPEVPDNIKSCSLPFSSLRIEVTSACKIEFFEKRKTGNISISTTFYILYNYIIIETVSK